VNDPLLGSSFLRGHHPILIDFGLIAGLEPASESPPDTGVPPFEFYEPARWAMGDNEPEDGREARPISAEELTVSSHHAWASLCCGKADTTA
jgi:hypothetical protein